MDIVNEPQVLGTSCLVVGGSGFLGRCLAERLLNQGYQVRVLDVKRHEDLDRRALFLAGDVRDPHTVERAVAGVDTVFHTAALMYFVRVASQATRQLVFDVNVRGTQNILDACRKHKVGRLVYTSSNNVALHQPIRDGDERTPYTLHPIDLYTETKVLAEQLVLAAGRRGELTACALRPGGIWGPYAGCYMLESVLGMLAKNTFVARVASDCVADNTHVQNLVDAQLLAGRGLREQPELVSGQAYFVTDDEPMNPVEWYRPLVEALGHSMPQRAIPAWPMHALGWTLEWLHRFGGPRPSLTRSLLVKSTRTHTFKIDKARQHLGYAPKIKSREGLLACVPYAQDYLARARAQR